MVNKILNNNKGISIVMITYNGEKFLKEQIDSIINQTIQPNEFIVCDDGSSDKTIEILQDYAQKGFIRCYINKSNLGVVRNIKNALALAKPYNYIALADQDDIWLPHKLQTLQDALLTLEQNNENIPSAVYSDLILVDKYKNILNNSFWNELNHDVHKHCFQTLLFGNYVTGCSMLINDAMKKELMQMPENEILHDVWMAFIGSSFGLIKGISEPLLLYRQHEMNQTYQVGNRKISKWGLRKKRFLRVFSKNDYLKNEYKIAFLFYNFYKEKLSSVQKKWLLYFLKTEKMPYLFKEIALKIFFWGKWK